MAAPPPIPGDHMRDGLGLPASSLAATFDCLELESGAVIAPVTLAYNVYGTLNTARDNAVIVGHSLTSNSCVHEWWGPLLGSGPGYALDTSRYFVVCANYLGSVYGSSGPLLRVAGYPPPMAAFPVASIRDNVRAQRQLLEHLGVRRVAVAIGGSLGGMLALEWAATYPTFVERAVIVAACAAHPDWAIALGEVGRRAIMADARWAGGHYSPDAPPSAGLAVARQLAMLSYRTPASFSSKFGRRRLKVQPAAAATASSVLAASPAATGGGQVDALQAAAGVATPTGGSASATSALTSPPGFEVEGYLDYQGRKFLRRFDAVSYVRLTQLLDTHDLGRPRASPSRLLGSAASSAAGGSGDYRAALRAMPQRVLVVGIASDLLYPLELQSEMASLIPRSTLHVIDSPHGHDSFLLEIRQLNDLIVSWLAGHSS